MPTCASVICSDLNYYFSRGMCGERGRVRLGARDHGPRRHRRRQAGASSAISPLSNHGGTPFPPLTFKYRYCNFHCLQQANMILLQYFHNFFIDMKCTEDKSVKALNLHFFRARYCCYGFSSCNKERSM